MESSAGESDDSADSPSVSLEAMERGWALHRPDMPLEPPVVTSDPCPFSWKPNVIEFRDFRVGRTYHRRVAIVNLSATRSSCRYIGLYEQDYYELAQPMADTLHVRFTPPGFLGTGLAARLELEFTPRLLADGACLVRFEAPNGEFHVPVRFVAQRCEPALDRDSLDFGDLVLGTRVRRSLLLRNTGSKGCRFTFRSLAPTPSVSEEDAAEGEVAAEPAPATGGGADGAQPQPSGSGSDSQPPDSPPSDRGRPDGWPRSGRPGSPMPGSSRLGSSRRGSRSPGSPGPGDSGGGGDSTAPDAAAASDASGGSGGSQASPHSSEAVVGSILQQLFDRLPIIDFDGGLGVCGSGEGELPTGGRARLHLGCVADLEGSWRQQFLVEFDDPACPPLTVTASFSGHVFPITVRSPHLSLDICLCGLTYWDNFEIVNTGKVASRVQTVVPEDIKPFVDIQDTTALVQAESSFRVKIHFKPKRALLSPPHRFFDPATHVLDFPVAFHVEGRSIRGSVQAAVSSNHVWLRPERLDFGRVTLLESACLRLRLTNGGLTTQCFQFTGLPESVSVQPGNGGGFVLPGETVPLDVIFSPSVTGQHQFTLLVETLDGGRATVTCRGLAVAPALSLSATSVKLTGAPVQGEVKAAVYVQCPKAPLEEEKNFSSGGSFEFQPPEGIPVRIHPLVGFVPYKQSRRVEVCVTPRLEPDELRITAALIQYERLELEETERLETAAQQAKGKKRAKSRKKSPSPKRQTILCPEPATIQPGSDSYRQAQQHLQRSYESSTRRYVIPCCVRHGGLDLQTAGVPDVLYLEVVCTTAAPQLVSLSPLCLDFGPRVLEATAYLPLELENTSPEPVRLRAGALDPHGPFRLVDPLGELGPGQRLSARVSYCPVRLSQELEFWTLHGGNTTLRYGVRGQGVNAQFSYTPEDGSLTLGKAKLGGCAKKQIVITNLCEAPLVFDVGLSSAAPTGPSASPPPAEPATGKGRGSGSARAAKRSARSEPEPEPAPPLWRVSTDQLTVEPQASAALDVLLSPVEEGAYEAEVRLRLFKRLEEVTFRVVGKTKGYKAPKPEKKDQGKAPKDDKKEKKSGKHGKKKKK